MPFDSCDLPQGSGTSSQTAQEIKKLVVCKDTGETMLHRAARLGHLVSIVKYRTRQYTETWGENT